MPHVVVERADAVRATILHAMIESINTKMFKHPGGEPLTAADFNINTPGGIDRFLLARAVAPGAFHLYLLHVSVSAQKGMHDLGMECIGRPRKRVTL